MTLALSLIFALVVAYCMYRHHEREHRCFFCGEFKCKPDCPRRIW